ncbi:N-glycosylase/DNA lyase [Candidatus Acidianus copahuensis]|uniref:8-oxoguanine DNA glycosylase/AP lyase n=1 Tax=Candidatus Acidianus copahuensis TaxID=1160895 RepID=A0A031LML3_9CREN|nr:N-glycosylase/DNA lyase [Candidatus Acidianus copahuensis]EZQ06853.1 DNA lyase [Candidatus Acidianus copahuensis]NON61922.1 N-glycosylase/DNA lyase [Acidianus sp. RZ1]
MLRDLVKNVKLRARVLERADEFNLNRIAGEDVWFRELLLCILTANSSFIGAYQALQTIIGDVLYLDEERISRALQHSGYRFYRLKAKYIFNAVRYYGKIRATIFPIAEKDQLEAREHLLELKGIGMKEASHFLRNVGYFDLAIIDRHILNFISYYINLPNSLTKRKYIYLESVLRSISKSFNIEVGLLDLFIWYEETKMIVK